MCADIEKAKEANATEIKATDAKIREIGEQYREKVCTSRTCGGCEPGRAIQGGGMYLQNLQWVWAGESNTGRRYVLAEPAVGVGRGEQYREKVCTCRTCSGCGPGRAIQGEGMYLQNLQWVWAGESNTGRRYVLAEPAVGVGRGEQYREKVWYVLAEPAVGVGRGEQYREKVWYVLAEPAVGVGRGEQYREKVWYVLAEPAVGVGRGEQYREKVWYVLAEPAVGVGRGEQYREKVCTCRTCSGCGPGRAIQGEGMYLQLQWV